MADTVITPSTGSDTEFDALPICNEDDYHKAMAEMMQLMHENHADDTPEDKRLAALALQVMRWERHKPLYTQFEFNGDLSAML